MKINSYLLTDKGRVRSANEDAFGSRKTPNGEVFVVCDGMGGHVGGATASNLAVESILDHLEHPAQNIYIAINESLQFANDQILGRTQEEPDLKGMGTTATILVVQDEGCIIAHVGDSRIYLKSDGILNRLTKDHSFVQGLVDQGVITDDQAETHPQKNQILEALGIKPRVNATIAEIPVKPKVGDCFLMCSDGLNGMINDDQISSLLEEENIEVSANNLIASANNAGGKDNITVCLVFIQESPFETSTFSHFNPISESSQKTTIIEDIDHNSNVKGGVNKKLILIIGLAVFILSALSAWLIISKDGEPKKPGNSTSPIEQKKDTVDVIESNELKPIENTSTGRNNSSNSRNNKDIEQENVPVIQETTEDEILDSLNNQIKGNDSEIDPSKDEETTSSDNATEKDRKSVV